ncbi:uncharacterized protein LOC144110617 [Amblyomma americanum]
MPGNVSKAARRLSKWRADTCRVLSRAACSDSLSDTVRGVLRKTANIFKTIKDDAFDEEQRVQLSRELVAVLCQVSSNLHFRARDLLLAVESVGVTARFDYWDNQCALLSYVVDLALALNEPSAVSKVLFILSKSKHRVWDALVQTEAIASTAALDERDRVLDVFRWLASYCPRTCTNPELYFKFVACAACLARRMRERGWKTVKPTVLSIEPAEFDFEEWFTAHPTLVALLPPSAEPRPRRKVIAHLCKSASSHSELLKACEAISESGSGSGTNIRSTCDAEATTEDDFFTIVDDGMESREQATVASQVEDQQLQVILESTLSRIRSSLASPHVTDNEPNSELISEASLSPLNTRGFLDKLLGCTGAGDDAAGAPEDVRKPRKRLDYTDQKPPDEASGLDGDVADEGHGSKGSTQEERASGDESCAEATPYSADSPHKIQKQRRKKKARRRKARQAETASYVTEAAEECGVPSAVTVGNEVGEPSSLQPSGRKCMAAVSSISDAVTARHDEGTPLKRSKRYSSTNDSPVKELCDQETAKADSKLPLLRERREAPQASSRSQMRPVAENVKAAFVQCSNGHAAGKLSSRESEGKLKDQLGLEGESAVEAVANCRSKAHGASKAQECWVIDSSEEESLHEECLKERDAHVPSEDANEPLSLGVESDGEVPCTESKSQGSEVRPSARVVKAFSPHRESGCFAGEVVSPKTSAKQSGSEVESDAEVGSQYSRKACGSRRAHRHAIKNCSDDEPCREKNVEENDVHSASDDADETTSNLGTEPSEKAVVSGSESEPASSQARPAMKVLKAASTERENSCIASVVLPEGNGNCEQLSVSDEDESAEEAISQHSRKACGARKTRRLRISDSSEGESCNEQNLEDGVHLASDDDVEIPSTMGAKSVGKVLSSGSDSQSANESLPDQISPSSFVKKRTVPSLSSSVGAASVGRKMVREVKKLRRSSSSSEEELHVKHVSKGNAEHLVPSCGKELQASAGSECESSEENSDGRSAASSSVKKNGTSFLSGRAARPSPSLCKTVSRGSAELKNRIGELSGQELRMSQVARGNNKISALKHTGRLEVSSGSESDLPLSQNASLSQSVKKVNRSRIVSSSEPDSSDDEHEAEVSAQQEESEDDEIPCGQRSPSISSLQHMHLSSSDSESEKGSRSLKLRSRCRLDAESDVDTVVMPSCDEEVPSEKQSTARLSQATTVAASPERRSASSFPQLRGAQRSQDGRQAESDANIGAKQDCAENSVFKLPTLKKARTVSTRHEAESKSQDGLGGLNKHIASSSSPYEKSGKGKTEPVDDTPLTRMTLRSRRSESSKDENQVESDQEGVSEPGCGDTCMTASGGATASTSLTSSAPVLKSTLLLKSKVISLDRSSLKKKQTEAHEGAKVNEERRPSPRKHSTSGPFHSEKAMHETSSEYDTDTSCSSLEVSDKRVLSQPAKAKQSREVESSKAVTPRKCGQSTASESEPESPDKCCNQIVVRSSMAGSSRKQRQDGGSTSQRTQRSLRHYSSTKSVCRVQVSSNHGSVVSDSDVESESPQKHSSPLSNEKPMSSVMRQKSGAHSDDSGVGRSEQVGPDSLQKSPSSPRKHDIPAEPVVQTKRTRRQLMNVSVSLSSERNEAVKCERAEKPGEAPDTLERSSSSDEGSITDDSIEQESLSKRLCPTSSKKKLTICGKGQKSGTNLDIANTCKSEQLAPSNQKSLCSPVKDDIPAGVLTRSARKRLSISREASLSPEKNGSAKSTRAAPDATSAWERLRNVSEEILDSDAESEMSSITDHSPSVATHPSSAMQSEEAAIVEKRLNGHKVVGESKRHLTRLRDSQAGFCTASQLKLRSIKNDAEAVAPFAGSQGSSESHSGSNAEQSESVARSHVMLEYPRQQSTQDLSQSSSNLDGLTQAPSSLPLDLSGYLPGFQKEADALQRPQRRLGQLGKKGCAVNIAEPLYSYFVSDSEDSGSDTASLDKENPTSPKADSSHRRGYGSGARKSGRLSLAAIWFSQSETSECPKSSTPVTKRHAVTNGALVQRILSTATQTDQSCSARASIPGSKKQASGAKKRPTRASVPRGFKNNRATEAPTSSSRQIVDAADMKESSARAPVTRRSARLSLMRSSLCSQADTSRLAAVTQEQGNPSDEKSDGRSTRGRSVRKTPSSKNYNAAHPRTPPVRVALDNLRDLSATRQRTSGVCSTCLRSSPATQDSGTMTDESYLHDEADFSNSLTSAKRRKTDSGSGRAESQQKTVAPTRKSRQCSAETQQPSAPVRRSTRTAASVSRRLSYA